MVLPALQSPNAHRGEMVFLRRSWYNRAGGAGPWASANPEEYLEFMRADPDLERCSCGRHPALQVLVPRCTQKEQDRRFAAARPTLKRWKLSRSDQGEPDKWEDYSRSQGGDVSYTDTPTRPGGS